MFRSNTEIIKHLMIIHWFTWRNLSLIFKAFSKIIYRLLTLFIHEVDYLEHFFFNCRTTIQFWKQVETHISLVTGKHFTIDAKTALFGIPKSNDISNLIFKFSNHVILIAKMCVSIAKKTNNVNSLYIIFENALKIRERFLHVNQT